MFFGICIRFLGFFINLKRASRSLAKTVLFLCVFIVLFPGRFLGVVFRVPQVFLAFRSLLGSPGGFPAPRKMTKGDNKGCRNSLGNRMRK